MDDRFSQINKIFQEELKKHPPKLNKKWVFLSFSICFLIASLCLSIIFRPNISLITRGEVILKNIQTAGTVLKAAIIDAPLGIDLPREPKNILLLGAAGPGNDAPDLTDTIILVRVDPGIPKVTLISIPRDLWVKMPESNDYTKINSLYAKGKAAKNQDYGLWLVKQKAEEITGQKIDYYVLVDLSVVKYIIDQQGGVNVLVKQDIHDPAYPGPNHSFQTFDLKAGWRYLNGETALKYIRTRNSLNGDFDRLERQQQVIEALKQKVFATNPIWDLPKVIQICNELASKVKTDFPMDDIPKYWQLAKKTPPENVQNLYLERKNNLVTTQTIQSADGPISIVKPVAGLENYSAIQQFIEENK